MGFLDTEVGVHLGKTLIDRFLAKKGPGRSVV